MRTRRRIFVLVAALPLLATAVPAVAVATNSSPAPLSALPSAAARHASDLLDEITDEIEDLIDEVDDLDLPRLERKLERKLRKALKAFRHGNTGKALRRMHRFIWMVEQRIGWKIPRAEAEDLIEGAQHIIDLIEQSGGQAPSLVNPGGQSGAVGNAVSLPMVGWDPDGGPVFWSATGLPPGLAIDPVSGRIWGTIASSAGSPFWVTVTATDNDAPQGSASVIFSWTVTGIPGASVFEVRVRASSDDVEEQPDGWLYVDSSDLELVRDGSDTQNVGLRFTGVTVPRNAVILDAWIQFTVDEWSTGAASLRIRANDVGHAAGFSGDYDVSTRAATAASVMWYPVEWTTEGEAGAAQRTPGLASLVQAIVNRVDWTPGNAMAFLIDGTGERTAESYDGRPEAAPRLHIAYTVP